MKLLQRIHLVLYLATPLLNAIAHCHSSFTSDLQDKEYLPFDRSCQVACAFSIAFATSAREAFLGFRRTRKSAYFRPTVSTHDRFTNTAIIHICRPYVTVYHVMLLHVIPLPVMTHAPLLRQLVSRVEIGVTAVMPMQFSCSYGIALLDSMLSET